MSAVDESQPQTVSGFESVLATLAYLGPLVVVAGLAAKDRAFVSFHVRQGLLLFLLLSLTSFFVWVPLVGWIIPAVIVIACLVAASQAAIGQQMRLPIIASVADRLEF